MDSWTQYLHRDHSEDELADWAKRLRWFRFCRAFGGHANDGDQLTVALRCTDQRDLDAIRKALGGPASSAVRMDVSGISLSVVKLRDRVLLSLGGADGDPFQVTLADVQNAERVEQALDVLGSMVLDPPIEDRHCVAPKFYPDFWDLNS